MTARSMPPDPQFQTESERQVFERLGAQGSPTGPSPRTCAIDPEVRDRPHEGLYVALAEGHTPG